MVRKPKKLRFRLDLIILYLPSKKIPRIPHARNSKHPRNLEIGQDDQNETVKAAESKKEKGEYRFSRSSTRYKAKYDKRRKSTIRKRKKQAEKIKASRRSSQRAI